MGRLPKTRWRVPIVRYNKLHPLPKCSPIVFKLLLHLKKWSSSVYPHLSGRVRYYLSLTGEQILIRYSWIYFSIIGFDFKIKWKVQFLFSIAKGYLPFSFNTEHVLKDWAQLHALSSEYFDLLIVVCVLYVLRKIKYTTFHLNYSFLHLWNNLMVHIK